MLFCGVFRSKITLIQPACQKKIFKKVLRFVLMQALYYGLNSPIRISINSKTVREIGKYRIKQK